MGRPKNKPARKDGYFEYKGVIGQGINGPIRKSFYSKISKKDAERKYQDYLVNLKTAEVTGVGFVEIGAGFTEWGRAWLESYKKPTLSENAYRWSYLGICEKHLFPYFKNADLRAIQPAHIQKFFNEHQHLSESMLAKLNMCLIGIFASAIENDKCYKNPALSKNVVWQSGKEKQEKRVYADEQISTLTALVELPEIVALLWTGMRIGELCGLMWQDVDMKNDVYTIQRSIAVKVGGGVEVRPPKWNSTRANPIEPTFKRVLEQQPKTSIYVFPNEKGMCQNPNTLRQKISRAMDRLPEDIPRLLPHELRHTYGTALRRRGVDIYSIQKIMGHKDIKMTTELYVHNEVDELKKAILVQKKQIQSG